MKASVMKFVLKLLNTTNVILVLAYPVLTQKAFVMDQNQITCCMDNNVVNRNSDFNINLNWTCI